LGKIEEEEEVNSLSEAIIRERMALKVELLQIIDDEEVHWFRRCHETWLLKGDNNSEFSIELQMEGRENRQFISL
jgi:hypothetical protein